MSDYFVIVGALRSAAKNMRDGMTPEEQADLDKIINEGSKYRKA